MADDIVFRIRAEGTDKFVKDLKKAGVVVEDTGETVEKENKKMGGSFSKLGKTIGAAFATAAVIQFTKVLAKAAIDIDATNAKIQTVFGESTREIEKFAKANATALGLTVNEYKRAAAAAGDLLIPIGFQRKQAADLSKDLVNLSGALSAWTGGQLKASEVSEILTKALLGEREQLKQLGIQISEADVKARLLEKGQKNLTGSSLAQAKALATLELVTEKSADAQAAFSDDTTTLAEANQQLTAEFRQLRDELATGIIPILTKTIGVVNDSIDGWTLFFQRLRGFTAEDLRFQELLDFGEKAQLLFQKQVLLDANRIRNQEVLEGVTGRRLKQIVKENAENTKLVEQINRELRVRKEQEEAAEKARIEGEKKAKAEEDEAKRLKALEEARKKRIKDEKELEKIFRKSLEDPVSITPDTDFADNLDTALETNAAERARNISNIEIREKERSLEEQERLEEEARQQRIQDEITAQSLIEERKRQLVNESAAALFAITDGIFDRQEQALQARLDAELITQEEFNEQRAEIQRKRAVADKSEAIFGITLNTARAITAALTLPIGGRILAGIIAGIAAAQLAQVLAAPIPQFAEGTKGRKKAPRGWAWVGEEGPELMQMKGGEKIVTNQDSDELMRLLGGYGIPVQFNTLEKSLYKPMTKMEALVSNSSTPVDINPLIRSNDMNRFSLGKKLDRIHEAIVSTSTRKMTRA